ncbi:hypothetical protein FH972_022740 [Carpinus fangiana]|uniref:Uncharacterized protein n=1 Tax=Carpinus fangiana TaxID=176857 RepID=A0A5N6KTG4_9ROSI|nr:hypothetical protein FH972_022740 [Carpinus fangiana]
MVYRQWRAQAEAAKGSNLERNSGVALPQGRKQSVCHAENWLNAQWSCKRRGSGTRAERGGPERERSGGGGATAEMLVAPRSFGYDPGHRSSASPSSDEKRSRASTNPPADRTERPPRKDGFRGFGWRPDNFRPVLTQRVTASTTATGAATVDATRNSHNAQPTTSVSTATSKPAEPPRTSPRPITPRKSHDSMARRRHHDTHDPNALTPSVAALLAMTSIPRKKKFAMDRRAHTLPRRMSLAELREEWRSLDAVSSSMSGSSPTMDVLLSPPDDDDGNLDFGGSVDGNSPPWPTSRSTSGESMPSLVQECHSFSSWTMPATPQTLRRQRSLMAKPERCPASPRSIDSVLDHPLVLSEDDTSESDSESSRPSLHTRQSQSSRASSPSPAPSFRSTLDSMRSPPRTSTFRSNLTASLQALRRAATSFSNFAAPSIVPDDHVSRGLLGPSGIVGFRSEMRPRQLSGTPTPQLRRYLNPPQHGQPFRRQTMHHDFHLHDSHIDHTDLEAAAYTVDGMSISSLGPAQSLPEGAVIPLQDYIVSEAQPASAKDGSSAFTTEAARAAQQQRREPRENSEFLRICVLELNMRRSGKMEGPLGVGPGRKAWWLPPREAGPEVEEHKESQEVPLRWRGVSAIYGDE